MPLNGQTHLTSAEVAAARKAFGPGAAEAEEITLPAEAPLKVIRPTAWTDEPVPPREWCVSKLVPAKTVTLLMGDGATGKSTLMLQLAIARSLGRRWLDLETQPGSTLVLSAEDDTDELHRRCDAIRKHYGAEWGDLEALTMVDLVGADAVLGELDHRRARIVPTQLYRRIEQLVVDVKADLVVIDALADSFAGSEIDRQHARQFVGLLKRLSKAHDLTVILIAHPSQSGKQSGEGTSGSTAWSNSARARLYFQLVRSRSDRDADPDLRSLTNKKSNYAQQGVQIAVRYSSGAFVPVEHGATMDLAGRQARAERVFLDLLRVHLETGQDVSAKPGHSYAPSRFASHPDSSGVTKRDFADALQRLLSSGRIKTEGIGPPSRRTSRLVIEGYAR